MADEHYDAIVIGTSQGGRFLPVELAKAGQQGGARRARPARRRLRQHGVHPDQDDGRQRAPRLPGAPRRGVRRADRPGIGRPGRGARAQAGHGRRRAGELREPPGAGRARPDRGRGPFHRAEDGRDRPDGRRDAADQRAGDRHRHGHQAQAAGDQRRGRRPGARLNVDHGAGRAPRAPDHPRRRLHRAGVRADVPPVRQRGHHHPERPAPDDDRGRGRLRRGRRDLAR